MPSRLYLDLNTQHLLQGIQCVVRHPHFRVFTQQELIWIIDFSFGRHKNWNNIHSFKLSSRLYQQGGTTQLHKLQVHTLATTKKMKEGNCSIHIGIIVSNSLNFKCWTQIDILSFGVFFKKKSHFLTQH